MATNYDLLVRNLPLIRLLARIKNRKLRKEILREGEFLQLGASICNLCKYVCSDIRRQLSSKERHKLFELGHGNPSRQRRDQLISQQGGFLGALLRNPQLPKLDFAFGWLKMLQNIKKKKKKHAAQKYKRKPPTFLLYENYVF